MMINLIATILPKLKYVFNILKTKITLVLIAVVITLTGIVFIQKNKLQKADETIGRLNSNTIALLDINYNKNKNNIVLNLKLSDLSNANDELIHKIDSMKSLLKSSKNSIKQAAIVQQSFTDTLSQKLIKENTSNTIDIDSVISSNCDFCTTITPNEYTSIQVCKEYDILTVIPDIRNDLLIYLSENKIYRNKRKNWFDRLFHWDWKKDKISNYEILNSNLLIKTENARVVNIND